MNSWKKVSNFVDFTTKGITPNYVEHSSIIVLNQKCIRNNRIDYSFAQYTDDTKKISSDKFVKQGDILVNSTGTGTAGRCAFVSKIPENYKLIVDSHILILRCTSYHEAQCLNYILFSFEKTLMSFMTGSSGQSELDKIILLNLKTKMTNKKEDQQKIASVLFALDSKIEFNNKINAELEVMAKMLYDYWFMQFDFPNAEGKPYKSSGGMMVWNKDLKRNIPKNWSSTIIQNILSKELAIKKIPSQKILQKGSIPVVDQSTELISGFTDDENSIIKITLPKIIFGDHTRVLKLINFDFARGADGTQILQSNSNRMPQHLFYHTLLKIDLSNYGYARHFKFLKALNIMLPDEKIANLYENKVGYYYNKIRHNIFENQKLSELRDWLLPLLMNGQVKID